MKYLIRAIGEALVEAIVEYTIKDAYIRQIARARNNAEALKEAIDKQHQAN